MEEVLISPLSSSSSSTHHSSLQQRLQFMVQSQQNDRWDYAIFWQLTTSNGESNGGLFLAWGDGHFQGTKAAGDGVIHNGGSGLNCHDGGHPDFEDDQGSNSCCFVDDDRGDVSDAQWFYVVSLARSFPAADDGSVPGRAFRTGSPVWLTGRHQLQFCDCERAIEALAHGVETLVCIPTTGGVLELGSKDTIPENWGLVQLAKSLFTFSSSACPSHINDPLYLSGCGRQ